MTRAGMEEGKSSSLGTNLTRFREPEDGAPQSYKRVKLDESLEGALAGRDANLNLFSSVVPLDLVGEICSHLSPLDVLKWSRSSKQFRRIFFNRSTSSSWWRNARRNAGIPDLKWELAEPAYASLLFDNYCMGEDCASEADIHRVNSYSRRRFCPSCAIANYKPLSWLAKQIGPISVELVQKCYVSFPGGGSLYMRPQDFRLVDRNEALKINQKLEEAVALYRAPGSADTYAQLLREVVDPQIRDAEAEIGRKEEDFSVLDSCLFNLARKLRDERGRKSHQRRKAIEAKLSEEGIESDHFLRDEWMLNSLVCNPRPLTTEEWEKIRKDIKVTLEIVEEQADGEAEEYLSEVNWEDRQDEISSRRDSLAAAQPNQVLKYTFPNSEQFLRLNSIKQLLEEDVEIDDERWDSFSEEIDADVLSYQQNLVNVYYKVARAFFDQDPTARRFLSTQSVTVEPDSEEWEREIALLVRFDYLIHFICSPDDYGPTCEFTDKFPNFCGHANDATSDSITVVNRRAEIVLELINSTSRLVNDDSIDSSKLDNLGQSFKCNLCRDSDLTSRWNSIVEHFLTDHKGSSVVGEIQFEDSEGK